MCLSRTSNTNITSCIGYKVMIKKNNEYFTLFGYAQAYEKNKIYKMKHGEFGFHFFEDKFDAQTYLQSMLQWSQFINLNIVIVKIKAIDIFRKGLQSAHSIERYYNRGTIYLPAMECEKMEILEEVSDE